MDDIEKILRKCERARRTDRWLLQVVSCIIAGIIIAYLVYHVTHMNAPKTPRTKNARTYMDDAGSPIGIQP